MRQAINWVLDHLFPAPFPEADWTIVRMRRLIYNEYTTPDPCPRKEERHAVEANVGR